MNQNNIIPSDPEETERDEPPASNYTPYKNKFIKIKSNRKNIKPNQLETFHNQ